MVPLLLCKFICDYGDQVKQIIVVNPAPFWFSMTELSFWSVNQNVEISVFSTVCMQPGKKWIFDAKLQLILSIELDFHFILIWINVLRKQIAWTWTLNLNCK